MLIVRDSEQPDRSGFDVTSEDMAHFRSDYEVSFLVKSLSLIVVAAFRSCDGLVTTIFCVHMAQLPPRLEPPEDSLLRRYWQVVDDCVSHQERSLEVGGRTSFWSINIVCCNGES